MNPQFVGGNRLRLLHSGVEYFPALEAAMRSAHPYELPEIIAVPVTAGLPQYLQWVADEVSVEVSTTSKPAG